MQRNSSSFKRIYYIKFIRIFFSFTPLTSKFFQHRHPLQTRFCVNISDFPTFLAVFVFPRSVLPLELTFQLAHKFKCLQNKYHESIQHLCEGGKKELNGNACILHCSSTQVYLVGSEKIKAIYHNIVTHYLQLLRNSIHTTATLHKK